MSAAKFARQAMRIRQAYRATNHPQTASCCKYSHKFTRENSIIMLHDAWAQFCRTLFIQSSIGGYQTRGNVILTRATNFHGASPNDPVAALRLRRRNSPPYWEPNWSVSGEFIRALQGIGAPNQLSISSAIGSTSSPAEQLRHTRNFLAHRTPDTAKKLVSELARYGASLPVNLETIMGVSPRSGYSNLFDMWVDDLISVAFAACQ